MSGERTDEKGHDVLPDGLRGSERDTWRGFLRVARLMDDRLSALLADEPVSTGEFGVLIGLAELGDTVRMTELAGHVLMSPSHLSHRAARLEGKGLLRRSKSGQDGRETYAELTAEGRAMLDRLLPAYAERIRADFLRHLTAAERRQLTGWMQRID
ncbi:MarR family transcriptional regulator [Calidifontibacter sp. DB0510]|uniref:MarR family transcriptional regulator n=1 Tax=Metallococcus carri TaxID=1656884 RepID=A0A967AXR1_9MICO|nr:MarR family transcriptional regulator [Metallococcus carri]NHN54936.1 MarR family transcriptional regulator [Metallococcus carri]NOP37282.1 MarR family transcriptional regulator [Calidifontibacter sp. DB2511S]